MGKIQRVYTKAFKQEAVRLAQTSGKPKLKALKALPKRVKLASVVLGGTHEPLGTTQTPGRPYA